VTRRDFERLAAAFAASRPPVTLTDDARPTGAYKQWLATRGKVALVLAERNVNFDMRRWCTATEDEVTA
jgi:hypothetical protein